MQKVSRRGPEISTVQVAEDLAGFVPKSSGWRCMRSFENKNTGARAAVMHQVQRSS